MNTFYLPNLNHNFVGYFLSVTESDADQLEKKTFEKSFEIFLEICPLCINIFQTLMNRLQKKVSRKSIGKMVFRGYFDFRLNRTIYGPTLDQIYA